MSQHITTITDALFDEQVTRAKGVVLVDFWAEWCGPCKTLGPVLDDVAEGYAGEARICKINADENKASAERFHVRGLPTMIVFVNGEEKERLLGMASKTRVASLLDRYLEG
jgi:thioredoxin 1